MPMRGELVGQAYVQLHADGTFVDNDIRDALEDADGTVKEAGDRHGKEYTDGFGGRMDALGDRIERIAERSGRLFGRGSRNNFVNFLGGTVTNTTRLLGVVPRLLARFAEMGNVMRGAFKEAGGGLAGIQASVVSLGPLLGGAAIGMGSLGIAAAAALPALAAVATLLLAIVGAVVALASSVMYAAIGAVAALGGAFAVAAIAGGTLATAIGKMSDAQKKMVKEATRPLVEEFDALGRGAARHLFKDIKDQATDLVPVVASLRPLFNRVAGAISDVASGWIDSLDSPGFREWIDKMDNFIPNAVRKLGRILDNTFTGLGGVFEAMIPTINRFLNWLEKVTAEFAEWANTKEGQREIKDFLDDAAASAKKVGKFLSEAVDFVMKLAREGRKTGDSMFADMAEEIEKFTNYLEANPDALSDFFSDAEDIAQDVADITVAVADLIGELDELLGHPLVELGMTVFKFQLKVVETAFWLAGKAVEGLVFALEGLWGHITGIGDQLQDLGDSISKFFSQFRGGGGRLKLIDLSDLSSQVVRAGRIIGRLPGLAREQLNKLPGLARTAVTNLVSPFAPIVGRIMGHFSSLRNRVRNTFDLGNLASAAARALASPFGNIVWRIMTNFSDLRSRVRERFDAAVDYVRDIPGKIAGFFTGLAGKILSNIGTIDIGSLIKYPSVGGGIPFIPGVASGGMFGRVTNGPMLRWVGEDGPEAIVPLDRDLSRVDPSVRALSAYAQGKGMASGGTSGNGKTIDASGWVIQSPGDPEAVAQEVLNRMFAAQF